MQIRHLKHFALSEPPLLLNPWIYPVLMYLLQWCLRLIKQIHKLNTETWIEKWSSRGPNGCHWRVLTQARQKKSLSPHVLRHLNLTHHGICSPTEARALPSPGGWHFILLPNYASVSPFRLLAATHQGDNDQVLRCQEEDVYLQVKK